MNTIRLSMESRKSIFRIETLSEEINPDWTIVFRSCFKDTLIKHLEESGKKNSCTLFHGNTIHWLQRSAMQASLYLPLASYDECIREMIIHLLKQHFEYINTTYSSLPAKNSLSNLELYRLAYPLQLAYLLYLRTEEISQFSLLFSSASSRVLGIWESRTAGSGKKIISEKELLLEVVQYLEEIFRNVTRHPDLEKQASKLKMLFEKQDDAFAHEDYAAFRRGISAETYQEKEKMLNHLIERLKEKEAKENLTELLFCQLLLNYFKV